MPSSRRATGFFVHPHSPINWACSLNRGLIGQWALAPGADWRGGSVLRDMVRGGKAPHDGTVSGATRGEQIARGTFGSLACDGSSTYFSLPGGTADWSASVAVQLSFWMKATSFADNVPVLKLTNGGNRVFDFFPNFGGSYTYFRVSAFSGGTEDFAINTSLPWDGKWHHITLRTRDAGHFNFTWDLEIWFDGVRAGADNGAYQGQAYTSADGGTWGFDGGTGYSGVSFADIALFSRWGDVQRLYQESSAGNPNRWNWLGISPGKSPGGFLTAIPGVASIGISALALTGRGSGIVSRAPAVASVSVSGIAPTGSGSGTASTLPAAAAVAISASDPAASPAGSASAAPGLATVSVSGVGSSAIGSGSANATPATANVTLSVIAPTITASGTVTRAPGASTITIAGIDASASSSGAIGATPGVATISIAGVDASGTGSGTATAVPGITSVTLAGVDVTGSSGGASATPGVAIVSITGVSPSVSGTGAGTATPAAASVALSALAPGVTGAGTATSTAGTASIGVSGVDVSGNASGSVSPVPGVATITLAAVASSAAPSGSAPATPGVATISISGVSPSLSGTGTATASPQVASVALTVALVSASLVSTEPIAILYARGSRGTTLHARGSRTTTLYARGRAGMAEYFPLETFRGQTIDIVIPMVGGTTITGASLEWRVKDSIDGNTVITRTTAAGHITIDSDTQCTVRVPSASLDIDTTVAYEHSLVDVGAGTEAVLSYGPFRIKPPRAT